MGQDLNLDILNTNWEVLQVGYNAQDCKTKVASL